MILARRTVLGTLLLAAFLLSLGPAVAWASWTIDSTPGGSGASAAATVDQGSTPSAIVSDQTITISWVATTLSTGEPVDGYLITRYDAATLTPQPLGPGCAGGVTTTSCVESDVPAGEWQYSVTPVVGTSWRGEQSVPSSPVAVVAPAPTSTGSDAAEAEIVVDGSAAPAPVVTEPPPAAPDAPTIAIGFAGRYNDAGFTAGCGTAAIDDVCGTAADDVAVEEVSVSLRRLSTGLYWDGLGFGAGVETWLPATGTESWTYVIASTSLPEGDYTLRARAGDGTGLGYAARTFTVDRTAPAAPVLTSEPPATSGPSATIAFTTTDPTTDPAAGFECSLDDGGWAACTNPWTSHDLAGGSRTVAVRAVDGAGNASAATSTTWTVGATTNDGAGDLTWEAVPTPAATSDAEQRTGS